MPAHPEYTVMNGRAPLPPFASYDAWRYSQLPLCHTLVFCCACFAVAARLYYRWRAAVRRYLKCYMRCQPWHAAASASGTARCCCCCRRRAAEAICRKSYPCSPARLPCLLPPACLLFAGYIVSHYCLILVWRWRGGKDGERRCHIWRVYHAAYDCSTRQATMAAVLRRYCERWYQEQVASASRYTLCC